MTNTDWQNYTGESTLSQFSQMFALVVHQFLSAATGMALAAAFIRGVIRTRTTTLGNFPCPLGAVFGAGVGAVEFRVRHRAARGRRDRQLPSDTCRATPSPRWQAKMAYGAQQSIPGGPVASMVPIEMIGDNGGGYFGANMAHPFQNPNPVINVLTIWLAAAIPFAFPWAYGRLVGSMRQATVVIVAMATLYVLSVVAVAA